VALREDLFRKGTYESEAVFSQQLTIKTLCGYLTPVEASSQPGKLKSKSWFSRTSPPAGPHTAAVSITPITCLK
jgi:hypothetical protein